MGRWHGEEVWADGMGRRYGQMAWGGGMGRWHGEEVWADGIGRVWQMAWGGGMADCVIKQAHTHTHTHTQVTLAYMKHLWQAGQRQEAFDHLSRFITSQKPLAVEDPAHAKLLAR